MATSYTLQHSSQYMENHRAALPLGPQASLAVAKTTDHGEMVFSIDEVAALRVTVGVDGTTTGFTPYVLSGDFSSLYPGQTASAKAFAVSQNASSSLITLVLAVHVSAASGGFDELWFLDGLSNDAGASWLRDASARPWSKLAFDYQSPDLPKLNAANLNIAALRVSIAQDGITPVALATVVDPGDQDELPFFVELHAPSGPSWSLLKPAQDYTETLDMALGRPNTLVNGLYLLVEYNQQTSLVFTPRLSYPPVVFLPPAGASALCAVPVLQGGVALPYTDLLVAGAGTLTLYPYNGASDANGHRLAPTPVLTASVINGVTALHAVVDGATLAVWGVNGKGQLFYTQVAYEQRSESSAWSAALPLLSGVVRAAPFLTEQRMISALFAVIRQGDASESLVVLHKDPVTNGGDTTWTQREVHLPAPDQVLTLKTYTTRLMLLDDTNMPVPGLEIGLTAASSSVVEIAGSVVTLLPTTPQLFATDAGGTVTIVQEVSSLSVCTYSVSVAGAPLATIDPTVDLRARLAKVSQTTLATATITDASGKSVPLVDKTRVQSTDLATAASGIQQATSLNLSASTTTLTVAKPETGGGIFAALGDLIQAVISDVESVVKVAIHAIEQGWALVVNFADQTFHALIQTAEDIVHAVYSVLRAIWVDIESAFRWLAFLFDWSDILAVQDALISLYDTAIHAVPDAIAGLKSSLDGWFTRIEAKLQDTQVRQAAFASVSAQPAKQQVASRQPTFRAQDGSDMRTDPRVNWAQSKLQTGTSTATTTTTSTAAALSASTTAFVDPLQPFIDAASNLATQFAKAFANIEGDTEALVKGRLPPGDWLKSVGDALALLGLELVQDVVDAVLSCIADLVQDGLAGLNTPIDIPLLSALFKLINGGKDLTLMNLACLLQAVVITISYKLVTGNSPTSVLNPTTIQGIGRAISGLGSRASSPYQQRSSRARRALITGRATMFGPATMPFQSLVLMADAAPAESGTALKKIRGGLQMFRALVMVVEGFEMPGPGSSAGKGGSAENTLFMVHFLTRMGIQTTEVVEAIEDDGDDPAVFVPALMLMYSLLIVLMAGSQQLGYKSFGEAVTAVRSSDFILSSLMGGLHLIVEIAEGCNDSAAILDDCAEIGDLPQHFAEEDPPLALIVLMIRTFAMLAAGGVNLSADA